MSDIVPSELSVGRGSGDGDAQGIAGRAGERGGAAGGVDAGPHAVDREALAAVERRAVASGARVAVGVKVEAPEGVGGAGWAWAGRPSRVRQGDLVD